MAKQSLRRRGSAQDAGKSAPGHDKSEVQQREQHHDYAPYQPNLSYLTFLAVTTGALLYYLYSTRGYWYSLAPARADDGQLLKDSDYEEFVLAMQAEREDGPSVAADLVRAGRVRGLESAVVSTAEGEVPLVLGVIQLYLMQYFPYASPDEKVIRRTGMLDLLSAMFARGASPDATSPRFFGGFPPLWVAVRKADVALVDCLVKGGARVTPGGRKSLLHELSDGLASGAFDASGLSKPLLHLQSALSAAPASASPRDVLYGMHTKFVLQYEQSEAARRLVSGLRGRSHPDLLRSELHEIDADLLEAILASLSTAHDFQPELLAARTPSGANAFHFAAEGSARCIRALAEVAARAGTDAAASALGALQSADSLGRTPMHVAASYGGLGLQALLDAAQRLSEVSGVAWRGADLGADQLGWGVSDYIAALRREPKELPPAASGRDTGRWSSDSYGTAQPGSRCDITVLEAPVNTSVLVEHVLASRPLLLRGEARSYKFRKAFRKDTFLKRHGHRRIKTSTVPYGDQFGLEPDVEMTVAEFVSEFDLSDGGTPRYAFTNTFADEHPQIRKDFDPLPAVAEGASINGAPLRVTAHQFFLGPPDSGASMHFHQDALNTLAYGRKRWLMLPPSQAVYSKRHPLELLDDTRYLAGGELETWECMQEAGDIIYVPNHWAHATINMEESIGVAYEFSVNGKTVHSFDVA